MRLDHCGEGWLVADDVHDGNFLFRYMRSRGETDRAGKAWKPVGKLAGIGDRLLRTNNANARESIKIKGEKSEEPIRWRN